MKIKIQSLRVLTEMQKSGDAANAVNTIFFQAVLFVGFENVNFKLCIMITIVEVGWQFYTVLAIIYLVFRTFCDFYNTKIIDMHN